MWIREDPYAFFDEIATPKSDDPKEPQDSARTTAA